MRVDEEIRAFAAAATGATLADISMGDADAFAVLLEISAHGGTATTTFVDVVPRSGSTVPVATASSDAIGHPVDLVATTGMWALSRIGAPGAAKTQFLGNGYWIPNIFKEMRVKTTLTGAGHTITGTLHIFRMFK